MILTMNFNTSAKQYIQEASFRVRNCVRTDSHRAQKKELLRSATSTANSEHRRILDDAQHRPNYIPVHFQMRENASCWGIRYAANEPVPLRHTETWIDEDRATKVRRGKGLREFSSNSRDCSPICGVQLSDWLIQDSE